MAISFTQRVAWVAFCVAALFGCSKPAPSSEVAPTPAPPRSGAYDEHMKAMEKAKGLEKELNKQVEERRDQGDEIQ